MDTNASSGSAGGRQQDENVTDGDATGSGAESPEEGAEAEKAAEDAVIDGDGED